MRLMPKFVFLCSYLVAVSIFYTQAYLTCLPQISHELSITESAAQFIFIANILGFGVSQIIYGSLSDIMGRKRIIMIGLMFAMIGSFGSFFSTNGDVLWLSQFIVGIGAGACSVIPRAVSKDVFDGLSLVKIIACMSIASTVAAGISPIIGAVLQSWFGWRFVFLLLGLLTIASIILLAYLLPETMKKTASSSSYNLIVKNYGLLFSNSCFLVPASLSALVYSLIIVYLTVTSFVFQQNYFYSASENGFVYLLCSCAYLLGNVVVSSFFKNITPKIIILIGIGLIVIGVSLVFFPARYHFLNADELIFCGMFIHLGAGIITPITYSQILNIAQFSAGITSAAIGSVRVFVAFLMTSIITSIATPNPNDLAYGLAVLTIAAAIICGFANKIIFEIKEVN